MLLASKRFLGSCWSGFGWALGYARLIQGWICFRSVVHTQTCSVQLFHGTSKTFPRAQPFALAAPAAPAAAGAPGAPGAPGAAAPAPAVPAGRGGAEGPTRRSIRLSKDKAGIGKQGMLTAQASRKAKVKGLKGNKTNSP